MPKIELDLETTSRLLRRAGVRRGADYVYRDDTRFPQLGLDCGTKCVYVDDGEDGGVCPACIVGEVFAEAGVDLSLFLSLRQALSPRPVNELSVGSLPPRLEELNLSITPAALKALAVAQNVQDDGGTWGEAIERGIEAGESYVDF